jgi:8-oxo-dGTP pyrophosphatase MutT (NUDIX family)
MASSIIKQINCSGGLFLSKKTKRFLFLLRTQGKTADTWGLVGGKSEATDKSPLDTLTREISEEIGPVPELTKIIPLDFYSSNDLKFHYGTYIILIDNEFMPVLNSEHSAYAWCSYGHWPRPLHRGVQSSFNNRIIRSKIELILELI